MSGYYDVTGHISGLTSNICSTLLTDAAGLFSHCLNDFHRPKQVGLFLTCACCHVIFGTADRVSQILGLILKQILGWLGLIAMMLSLDNSDKITEWWSINMDLYIFNNIFLLINSSFTWWFCIWYSFHIQCRSTTDSQLEAAPVQQCFLWLCSLRLFVQPRWKQ